MTKEIQMTNPGIAQFEILSFGLPSPWSLEIPFAALETPRSMFRAKDAFENDFFGFPEKGHRHSQGQENQNH